MFQLLAQCCCTNSSCDCRRAAESGRDSKINKKLTAYKERTINGKIGTALFTTQSTITVQMQGTKKGKEKQNLAMEVE